MLQVPALIMAVWIIDADVNFSIAIACPRDQRCSVHNQAAELSEGLLKPWKHILSRPDVRICILWEIRICLGKLGSLRWIFEGWSAVDVVGTLESIVMAVFERFFATGPADEPFCGWALEFGFASG